MTRDHPLPIEFQNASDGFLAGVNSLVQAAMAKARGYRSLRNLMAIIYFIVGKIDLKSAA